ncbi:MAG: hypothetical protein ACON35_05195 [Candidatus Marinamargulisbacteria bacterium]
MKKKLLLTVLFVLCLNSNLIAATNAIKFNVLNIPRPFAIEYERKLSSLLPGLRAFASYGSGSVKYESYSTDFSGITIGARLKIPFLGYIGTGFGSMNADYSYVASKTVGEISVNDNVIVDGKLSGLFVEYGQELSVGPVLAGVRVAYLMAKPALSATVAGNKINDTSSIDQGLAKIPGLPEVSAYVGINF